MENSTVSTTTVEQHDAKYWLKFGLAWTLSLAFLFIVFYVAARAWKSGQQAAS